MLKRTVLALLICAFAAVLFIPARALAQVSFGITVGPVVPRPYGYVVVPPLNTVAPMPYGYAVVPPAPYVVSPPVVVVPPRYVYPAPVYPGGVFIGGRWYPKTYRYRPGGWGRNGWRW